MLGIQIGDRWTVNEDTHVATLMTTSNDNRQVYRNTDRQIRFRLQDGTTEHYIHYSSDLAATTNAHLNNTLTPVTEPPLFQYGMGPK